MWSLGPKSESGHGLRIQTIILLGGRMSLATGLDVVVIVANQQVVLRHFVNMEQRTELIMYVYTHLPTRYARQV